MTVMNTPNLKHYHRMVCYSSQKPKIERIENNLILEQKKSFEEIELFGWLHIDEYLIDLSDLVNGAIIMELRILYYDKVNDEIRLYPDMVTLYNLLEDYIERKTNIFGMPINKKLLRNLIMLKSFISDLADAEYERIETLDVYLDITECDNKKI